MASIASAVMQPAATLPGFGGVVESLVFLLAAAQFLYGAALVLEGRPLLTHLAEAEARTRLRLLVAVGLVGFPALLAMHVAQALRLLPGLRGPEGFLGPLALVLLLDGAAFVLLWSLRREALQDAEAGEALPPA